MITFVKEQEWEMRETVIYPPNRPGQARLVTLKPSPSETDSDTNAFQVMGMNKPIVARRWIQRSNRRSEPGAQYTGLVESNTGREQANPNGGGKGNRNWASQWGSP